MKKKITNPFVTSGYAGPDYFCDRKDEIKRVLKSVSSGRNLTMISLRRMGKTGLLKHSKHILENSDDPIAVIYVDLLPTMNGTEMLTTISSALLNLKNREKKFFEKVLGTLGAMRPRLT
jgi:hypothetical protein